MARRKLAGRDEKIAQGHRRDAFFAKMRRRGGVPRKPDQAPAPSSPAEAQESASTDSAEEAAAE